MPDNKTQGKINLFAIVKFCIDVLHQIAKIYMRNIHPFIVKSVKRFIIISKELIVLILKYFKNQKLGKILLLKLKFYFFEVKRFLFWISLKTFRLLILLFNFLYNKAKALLNYFVNKKNELNNRVSSKTEDYNHSVEKLKINNKISKEKIEAHKQAIQSDIKQANVNLRNKITSLKIYNNETPNKGEIVEKNNFRNIFLGGIEKLNNTKNIVKTLLIKKYWLCLNYFKNVGIKKWLIIAPIALFFIMLVSIFLLYFSVKFGLFGKLPDYADLKNISNQEASLVFSADKELIGNFYNENRSAVDFEYIPTHIIEALIATEDSRFMEHDGIDFKSLMRVFFKSILLGDDKAGGGSTISQQLVKNLYGRKIKSFLSMPIIKIREMIIASRIEKIYDKNEILCLYLNTVSFGENVFGIENAAMRYFSKNSHKLTIEEGSVLIGMLKANTYYNPHINPQNALGRRNVVLGLMHKSNNITKPQYDSLTNLPLLIKYKSALDYEREQGYFLAYIKNEAEKYISLYNEANGTNFNLLKDGLIIETSLHKKMQDVFLKANNNHLLRLQKELDAQIKRQKFWDKNKHIISDWEAQNYKLSDKPLKRLYAYGMYDSIMELSTIDSLKYNISRLQSAVLAADPHSGAIKVWIGGSNFRFFPYNRVLAKRQVGSTFKPIVYYTALEKGIKPCKFYKNEKFVYEDYDNWSPGNGSDTSYTGYYSVRGALANSVNTIAAQVLFDAGIDNSIKTAQKLGITSNIPNVPSIVLGVADISLYEMVQAYSSFANKGYKTSLYAIERIKAKDGTVIYEKIKSKQERILDATANEQLVKILNDVINDGTGKRIRDIYKVRDDIAGKTGTTQNNTDGWFIGFTPNLVMGVWVGADNPIVRFSNTAIGQGANTALPIWITGYERTQRYSWGKQYAGKFNFSQTDTINCEFWKELDASFFEKLGMDLFGLDSQKREERKEQRRQERNNYNNNEDSEPLFEKVKGLFQKKRHRR